MSNAPLLGSLVNSAKMVLITRTDLGMGKGKIAAQCSHAAVDLYDDLLTSKDPLVHTWVSSGFVFILKKVGKLFVEILE